ncbi:MAG: methyltransferase domain-containing protein [Verrucomicrobia bacterium]|nr:methyltransferase domain-containing protein [Verrucomicrobiota bacterium]
MGWLREKYTRAYFLHEDEKGNRVPFGADGVKDWAEGRIYRRAQRLLDRLDFDGAVVLDIGFGRGEAIRYALRHGASRVIGVDFAQAAVDITRQTLREFPADRYELVCADVLDYLGSGRGERVFRHILMLDSIEHIPRNEVEKILPLLAQQLEPGGTLVICTPFYEKDDDVLAAGGKRSTRDESDDIEETRGMHINRYTKKSLSQQVCRHGFVRWLRRIFLKPLPGLPLWLYRGPGREWLLRKCGYRVRPPA